MHGNASELVAIAALFALSIHSVRGQYAWGSVASCNDPDFDCQWSANRTGAATCSFQGQSYQAVGMVPFESPLANGSLEWTVATAFKDENSTDPHTNSSWVRDYFFDTPPGLNLQAEDLGYYGCAAFLIDSNATFPLYNESGTCSQTIGESCYSALRSQAIDAASSANITSSEDLCSRLEDAFTNNNLGPSSCSAVTLKGLWGRVRYRALTGPNAPQAPTVVGADSSTCHPAIPSSYVLRPALSVTANSTDSLWSHAVHPVPDPGQPDGITNSTNIYQFIEHQAVPIITVFAASQGNKGISADVSCLGAPRENKVERDGPHLGAASSARTTSWVAITSALIAGIWSVIM